MPYRDLDNTTLIISAVAALLGAVARWTENGFFKQPFSFPAFVLDMCISIGIGMLCFWVVIDLGQPASFGAAVSAVGGNIGSRIFSIAQNILQRKAEKELDE